MEPEVFSWVFVGGCAVVVKEKALQKCTGSLAEFFLWMRYDDMMGKVDGFFLK